MKLPNYKNLVMITLDCVRPDFLGCYGNTRVRTPNIDRLAASGVVFEQAISQAPCTWVSHAGIFTGTFPSVHGLRTPFDPLSGEVTTLAEVLSGAGYGTFGFPANDLVGSRTGLNRGFQHYYEDYATQDESGLNANQRNSWPNVMRETEKWLPQQKNPFFAWFHYLDTHHLSEYDLPDYYRLEFNRDWQFYEGKISYADDICVGKILALLERCGMEDNTLLVILSDHGEELGMDGLPRHNGDLSDSVLRVPLIFSGAGDLGSARRIPNQVSTVDIMPTILNLLGLPLPSTNPINGKNRLNPDRESGPAYAENLPLGLAAVRTEEWKYIRSDSGELLFHLPSDPRETRNVLDRNPVTGEFLKEELKKISQGVPHSFSSEIDALNEDVPCPPKKSEHHEETLTLLKSLGYI